MAPFNTFNTSTIKSDVDFINIRKKKNKISFSVSVLSFIDKDTKQYVYYVPSFDLSGYGSTKGKALEMIKHSLDDFFVHLMGLKPENIRRELRNLGWKQNTLHKKEFSNAHIDMDGNLMDFNAKDNKVSISKLQAA